MEQSEEYKALVAKIKALQLELSFCANRGCEQSGAEAVRVIEEHFAKCHKALETRKAALLDEVEKRVKDHSMSLSSTLFDLFRLCTYPHLFFLSVKTVEAIRVQLDIIIEACTQNIRKSVMMYAINKTAVETYWKVSIQNLFTRLSFTIIIPLFPSLQLILLQSIISVGAPEVPDVRITTELPESLHDAIVKHGKGISISES